MSCFKTEDKEEYNCPKGFTPAGKYECEKYEVVPQQPICPKGCEENKANKCVAPYTDFEFYCPKGTEQKGKVCINWESTDLIEKCPESCQQDKNQCYKVEFWTEDVCPKGTEQKGKECFKWTSVAQESVCPKGCESNKEGQCLKKESYTEKFCPKGFEACDEKCTQWEKRPVAEKCPAACQTEDVKKMFIFSETQCYKTVDYTEEQCPKGTEEKAGKCWTAQQKAPLSKCPEGADNLNNGQCKYTKTTKAVPVFSGKKL